MKLDRARMGFIALVVAFPIAILFLSSMVVPSASHGTTQNLSGTGASGVLTATTSVTRETQQTSQGTVSSIGFVVLGQNSSSLGYFYLVLALVVISLTVFFASSSKRKIKKSVWIRKAQNPKSNTLLAIVAAYVGLVLLGLYLASRITLPILANPSMAITYAQIAQLMVVGISCSVVALSLYVFYRTRNRISEDGSKSANPTDELLAIIQNAANKLDQENVSYREIIIDCYKQVLILFESLGIPQRSNLTPREFEDEITRIVGGSFPELRELTLLFERAKYSNEELSKYDVVHARDNLSRMGLELQRQLNELVLPVIRKVR